MNKVTQGRKYKKKMHPRQTKIPTNETKAEEEEKILSKNVNKNADNEIWSSPHQKNWVTINLDNMQ